MGDPLTLFDLGKSSPVAPKVQPLRSPIWTENKAKLIERYLYYFVLVTKHGTYIDGFAGPQEPDKPEMWAAKLVIECEPRWLRRFYLFDDSAKQVDALKAMVAAQPPRKAKEPKKEPKRTFDVRRGDFNEEILGLLGSGVLSKKDATFCLLDQRTFECQWSTLEALARFKETGHKIELFYFLPNGWLDRAFAAQKDLSVLERWWAGGPNDWERLRGLGAWERARLFSERFRKELGYVSATPWPIYERRDGGTIMYFMIHATDHPQAPKLMSRAYRKAVTPKEPLEQLTLDLVLGEEGGDAG